jgi:beta-lactamase class A
MKLLYRLCLNWVSCTMLIIFSVSCLNATRVAHNADEISRIIDKIKELEVKTASTLGVSIVNTQTGERISYHGDEHFPMASVFKVPLAVRFLKMVDEQAINLDDTVTITSNDLRPGSGWLIENIHPGDTVRLSKKEIFELMLIKSDNAASDMIMEMVGGPAAVSAQLKKIGIQEVRVDRSIAEVMLDYFGVAKQPAPDSWDFDLICDRLATVSQNDIEEGFKKYLDDPRDTATPEAYADLLRMIYMGKVLKISSTRLLLETLRNVETGEVRLKGKLPAGTVVAHKTGTAGSLNGTNAATNDVGIISLPHANGAIVITVFIKKSESELNVREQAIAEIGRLAYDYWEGNAIQLTSDKQ